MHSGSTSLKPVLVLVAALVGAYLLSGLVADPARKVEGVRGSGAAVAGVEVEKPTGEPTTARAKPGEYVARPVEGGGTIRVLCKLTEAPPLQTLPLNKDLKGCGHTSMPSERCVFDATTLGLAGCIVGLTDITEGKAFEGELADEARTVVLDQKGCRYVPHVMLVRPGTKVAVKNSDPVEHNVKAFFKNRGTLKFNLFSSSGALLEPTPKTTLEKPGLYPLMCDVHFWMTGFIRAVPHPYHAVTGPDGTAVLTDVPPGRYRIGGWHEGMRVTLETTGSEVTGYAFSADVTFPEQVVEVSAGRSVDVTFVVEPR